MAPDIPWLIRMERRLRPDGDFRWWERLARELPALVPAGRRSVLLDVGCGERGHFPLELPAGSALRVGLDIDPDAARNPELDRFVRASAEAIPLRGESVDLLISSYVLEHLRDPDAMLREFARVLRPGGTAVFWTSNRWNYAIAVSAITPTAFHNWVRRLSQPGQAKDNCPTHYRLNTPGALAAGIARAGLELREPLRFGSGAYHYFKFSKPLFTLAALASRVARHTPLRRCKSTLIAICGKPDGSALRRPASGSAGGRG